MRSDARLAEILTALEETSETDAVTEERTRRHAARQSRVNADVDAMQVDDESRVSEHVVAPSRSMGL